MNADEEFEAWKNREDVSKLIEQLKVEHPDYDDNMIYQMAFMRTTKEA